MNKKGFTLMELLLVVAVLAIVAAAAAPAFFSGAAEAVKEAKRAQFLSAYSNSLSAANMYMSIKASKGGSITAGNIAETELIKYVPAAARTFKKEDNSSVLLTVDYNENGTVTVKAGGTAVTADTTWAALNPAAGS